MYGSFEANDKEHPFLVSGGGITCWFPPSGSRTVFELFSGGLVLVASVFNPLKVQLSRGSEGRSIPFGPPQKKHGSPCLSAQKEKLWLLVVCFTRNTPK